MEIDLRRKRIAIIGGADPCKAILEILAGSELKDLGFTIAAVADTDDRSEVARLARDNGIFTTMEYKEVLENPDLDLILLMGQDEILKEDVEHLKSSHTELIILDHFQAMSFLTCLKTKEETLKTIKEIATCKLQDKSVENVFEDYSNRISRIAGQTIEALQSHSEDLIESEKELSQIIHGSMIPTFVINKDHIVTHWNKACEELTGYMAYELLGTDRQWAPFRSAKRPTMADVIVSQLGESDISRYYGNSWHKSSLIKEAYEAEEFFPHLGKNGKWIFFTAAPIKNPKGQIVGAIETLRETTEDKKTQEELALQDLQLSHLYDRYKKSEEKYRLLFNNNPNPIFIIDSQTLEILDVNDRVVEDYGYSKNELLGASYLFLCDRNDESLAQSLKSIPKDKSVLFPKKKHFKKGKKSFYVNVKICNTRYSHRDVLIAAATDITESVEKETQLIQAGKMATLGTMAAGMAHEINQPLNVIQICADLMLKMMKKGIEISNEELTTMSKDIIANVARASGVIKHVRDFARQSDRILKKLNINEPINDVFKVLGHQLIVHQIKVNLEMTPELPDIQAEHNRLEQVFINLVTNAIDSMDEKAERNPDKTIEKVLTIKTFAKNDRVFVTVTDTGLGMNDEVKNKIFEPFFTTKDTGKGTGLGTSISFGIIKDYSGTIEIESEEGVGATFIISFPCAK